MLKAKEQPLCRWCGRPLRKYTTTVRVKREKDRSQYDLNYAGRAVYVDGDAEMPRTIDDCRRLSNQQVVKVSRETGRVDGEYGLTGFIDRFAEWDGETYRASFDFFCTNDCAMEMGRAAVAGNRLAGQGWHDAVRKAKERKD